MTNERFTLNAKVLNQLQETLLTSKKHVEFWRQMRPKFVPTYKALPKHWIRLLACWKIKYISIVITPQSLKS